MYIVLIVVESLVMTGVVVTSIITIVLIVQIQTKKRLFKIKRNESTFPS